VCEAAFPALKKKKTKNNEKNQAWLQSATKKMQFVLGLNRIASMTSAYDIYSCTPESDGKLIDDLVASQRALAEANAKLCESKRLQARKSKPDDDQNAPVSWWFCIFHWCL
jgi:hypothetical protein